MLFNAGLETAIRRWRARLQTHGLLLCNGSERLTNIRYADDLMLYAKSSDELCAILELLVEELDRVGLALNADKTKAFATACLQQPLYLDNAGGMIG